MNTRMMPRITSRVRWANSSASCSKPPGNILEAVEEIADLTPETRPEVRPVRPSPIPVPMPVLISPMIPPVVVVVVVVPLVDVPVVEVPPLLLLPPLVTLPNRSVTRPPKMSVKKVPIPLPMSEKIVEIPELPELGVLVLAVEVEVEVAAAAGLFALLVAGVGVVGVAVAFTGVVVILYWPLCPFVSQATFQVRNFVERHLQPTIDEYVYLVEFLSVPYSDDSGENGRHAYDDRGYDHARKASPCRVATVYSSPYEPMHPRAGTSRERRE